MRKRVAATVLWAMVGWMGGGLVAGIFGAPMVLALIPTILMPAFVLWDPSGVLWSRSVTGKRIVRPINELAAELDRKAAKGIAAQEHSKAR